MEKTYKEFYGKNTEQMPKLLAEGLVPANASDIMKYRLKGDNFFINNYFDTSDLIAYDSDKSDKIKFILTVNNNGKITKNGRNALNLINPQESLISGAMGSQDKYGSLSGNGIIEISKSELGKLNEYLTRDEILNSKSWRILARHPNEVPKEYAEDEKLLLEYADKIQSITRDRTNMGVFLDSHSKNSKLRAWFLYRPECRSNASASNYLDDIYGRFVGFSGGATEKSRLEKEVLVAPTLKQILKLGKNYIPKAVQKQFEEEIKNLYNKK